MLKIEKPIIVEGKYDKIKLESFLDAIILETDGFQIFSDPEKKSLIRYLARTKGIIVLTDSDAAGFKIRNYLQNIAADGDVLHVYIPDVYGKEKRKAEPSKEGKLGVEGLSEAVLLQAFTLAGITPEKTMPLTGRQITAADLLEDGFTGCPNAKEKKYKLLRSFGLPVRLSNTQMLRLLNTFLSYEDYRKAADTISDG